MERDRTRLIREQRGGCDPDTPLTVRKELGRHIAR